MATLYTWIHTHWPQIFVMQSTKDYFKLKPEQDESGNIEYKRILTECSSKRIRNYTTQMLWRIMQSKKQRAIYYIGVDDDGSVYGLTVKQTQASLTTFIQMVEDIEAKITKIHLICVQNKYVLQIKIQLKQSKQTFYEL